jgi:hypothetical protein
MTTANPTIDIKLSVEETNQILTLLGDQAIKTGLADLTTKIKGQGDAQLAAIAAASGAVTPVEVEVV